jgi:transcriptional regulator
MAKVISHTTPEVVKATPEVVKVSRKVVELISELSEVRATYNSAKARVDELRNEVLSTVGRANLTLIHNSIEVARIVESAPVRIDEEFLKENYPEAYQASLKAKPQHTIRSVTRKAN